VILSSGKWKLTTKAGVHAWAMCGRTGNSAWAERSITLPNFIGMPGGNGGVAVNPSATEPHLCALTGVGGALKGAWVGTYLTAPLGAVDWKWWLGSGNSNGGATLKAYARCVW
jgi:hypothetical protein